MNRPFLLLFGSLALVAVALAAVFLPGGGSGDAREASDTTPIVGTPNRAEAPPAGGAGEASEAAAATEAAEASEAAAATGTAEASQAADAAVAAEATDPTEPAEPAEADAAQDGADGPAGAEGVGSLPPVPVPDGFEALPPLGDERRVAFEGAEDVLDPSLDYAAVIETNRGTIVVDLFEVETPATVNNFVFLAGHRYYDGIVFHRVIEDFMAQTGDPTGTGTGGPGYRFDDEIVEGLGHDGPGVLSMANAGPGTNGSQFFLTFGATPWLDGAHTVFGRVIDGLPVLDSILRVDPQQPSVVALLSDPASAVRDEGIDLPGDGTVEEALTAALGAPPVAGPSLEVAGARVAIGTADGQPAAGFFPFPDRMERVTIVARPRE